MPDKEKQCCGNCGWFSHLRKFWGVCEWNLLGGFKLPDVLTKEWIIRDFKGTTCSCHKFREVTL